MSPAVTFGAGWGNQGCLPTSAQLPLGHLVLGQLKASKINPKTTLDLTSSLMGGCPGNLRVMAARYMWLHGVTWSVTSRCDP